MTRSVRVTVTLPDEQRGQALLTYLADSESDAEFSVDWTGTEGVGDCTVPISNITPKQWEAATLAVEAGYYDDPKETDLDELARSLGVSASALSQRLNAVERKLMTAFVSTCEDLREV